MTRDALSRRTSASAVLVAAVVLLFLGACAETKPKSVEGQKKLAEEPATVKSEADERAAAEERARTDEARRQAAEREKAQADLLVHLQQIERSARVEPRGIILTLPGSVYFDSSRSDVKPGARERLARIGQVLAGASRPEDPRGRSHRLDRAGQVQHEALRAQGRVRENHPRRERRFPRPNRDPWLRFDKTGGE